MTADADADEATSVKQRLLEAAIEEFADHGYQNATIRQICSRANANVNAVKYYFEDKHNLYLAALQHAHSDVHSQMMAFPPDASQPRERLRWFIRNMMRVLLSRTGRDTHHLLLVHEMLSPTAGTQEIVKRFIQPRFQMLLDTLRELAPHVSDEKLRLIGYSVIGQCMHFKMAKPIVEMLTPTAEYADYSADHLSAHILSVTEATLRDA